MRGNNSIQTKEIIENQIIAGIDESRRMALVKKYQHDGPLSATILELLSGGKTLSRSAMRRRIKRFKRYGHIPVSP